MCEELEAVGSGASMGIVSDGGGVLCTLVLRSLPESPLSLCTGAGNYGPEESGWGLICGPCSDAWLEGIKSSVYTGSLTFMLLGQASNILAPL